MNLIVDRSWEKKLDIFKIIFKFIESLQNYDKAIWTDGYGITTVEIKENILYEFIQKLDGASRKFTVILSPLIEDKIRAGSNCILNKKFLRDCEYILSIGGAKEHNIAKEYFLDTARKNHLRFICSPLPLSNDSFCTNRCSPCYSKIEVPSRVARYPSQILIDIAVLNDIDQKLNIVGVGEVIGLYYSIMDYCTIHKIPKPDFLLKNIDKFFRNLISSLIANDNHLLKHLAINLLLKCLVMRVVQDNRIGAGGDHLIAYAFDYYYRNKILQHTRGFSHGESVYLGSIAMAALFPEWEYGCFTIENLVGWSFQLNILSYEDIELLIKFFGEDLISSALKMRPNRRTSLSQSSRNRINKALIKINGVLAEVKYEQ